MAPNAGAHPGAASSGGGGGGRDQRPPSPSPSQLPPVPRSPTFSYASTANPSLSHYNLPLPPPPRPAHAVLTKADLEHSQTAYADLLSTAKSYRVALASLSTAASAFGSALEACARLKEARAEPLGPVNLFPNGGSLTSSFHGGVMAKGSCTADTLLTVAGLQHLVANHQQILSETVYRAFEVPLLHELDKWRGAVDDEEEGYATAVAAQSAEIRRLEKEGMKLHKQRRRDVGMFRNHLVELTTKLDGLTAMHGEHARTLLRESQETSVRIVEASCSLVRAEVDIFESLARKGWTGGGLEDVLERGVDLFASEFDPASGHGAHGGKDGGHHGVGGGLGAMGGGGGTGGAGEGSKLFSILPPKSILADTSGPDTIRAGQHARADSLLMDTDRYQSLAGLAAGVVRDRDSDSVFSEFNRSRGVRPFSPQPQPLRLNPEKLLGTSLEVSGGGDGDDEDIVERNDVNDTDENDDDDDDDDEDAHPWRNEGLGRRLSLLSDDEEKGTVEEQQRKRLVLGASLGEPQSRGGGGGGGEDSWNITDTNSVSA
ncbi:hypothetical protein QBC35DRAFT_546824 [Podospora australis]|uniref:Phospholipid-binding protein n=1 Tax=Podospora australis TaxID=1536484 RepID=A0AAN6WXR5_9PEZI|nr:hypothetical protein QBC35DRAFT_546824 [Podospora australis]